MANQLKKEIHDIEGTYLEIWKHPDREKGLHGCIIHGLGEHAGRYESTVRELFKDERIMEIVLWDHQGHGKSKGRRGDIKEGFQGYVDHSRRILLDFPGLDWVWGHSMGALILLDILESGKYVPPALQSAIFTAPPFIVIQQPNFLQKLMLPYVSKLAPQLTLSNGLLPTQISTIKNEQDAYKNDPLVHDRISVRVYKGMMNHSFGYKDKVLKTLKENDKVYLHFAHGGKDTITTPEYQSILVNAVNVKPLDMRNRLTCKVYDRSSHELHHDIERSTFIQDLLTWIKP